MVELLKAHASEIDAVPVGRVELHFAEGKVAVTLTRSFRSVRVAAVTPPLRRPAEGAPLAPAEVAVAAPDEVG